MLNSFANCLCGAIAAHKNGLTIHDNIEAPAHCMSLFKGANAAIGKTQYWSTPPVAGHCISLYVKSRHAWHRVISVLQERIYSLEEAGSSKADVMDIDQGQQAAPYTFQELLDNCQVSMKFLESGSSWARHMYINSDAQKSPKLGILAGTRRRGLSDRSLNQCWCYTASHFSSSIEVADL